MSFTDSFIIIEQYHCVTCDLDWLFPSCIFLTLTHWVFLLEIRFINQNLTLRRRNQRCLPRRLTTWLLLLFYCWIHLLIFQCRSSQLIVSALKSCIKYFYRQLFWPIWEVYRTFVHNLFHNRPKSCKDRCYRQCPSFPRKCWFPVKVWSQRQYNRVSEGTFQWGWWDSFFFQWFFFPLTYGFGFLFYAKFYML